MLDKDQLEQVKYYIEKFLADLSFLWQEEILDSEEIEQISELVKTRLCEINKMQN